MFPQNAGRDQVQRGLLSFDDQRMTRIVTTLEADHRRHLFSEQINDLALTLVTPLGAQHYNILSHDNLSYGPVRNRSMSE